ncbi:MAG: hypothetical protein PHC34_07265 [Candidatus Gastranaerophilales bacterium]|nr:hypothetical protein [Candidatus Gastranaerophilales bacterium]
MSLNIGQPNPYNNFINKNLISGNSDSKTEIISEDEKKEKSNLHDKKVNYGLTVLAGYLFYKEAKKIGGRITSKIISPLLFKKPVDISLEKVTDVAEKMIEKNKLREKGFKYNFISLSNSQQVEDDVVQTYRSFLNKLYENFKILPNNPEKNAKKINKAVNKFRLTMGVNILAVKNGKNAFFAPLLNYAVAPKTKPFFILHEVGHAITYKKLGIPGFLCLRMLPLLTTVSTIFISLIHKKKDVEEKSFLQKTGDFIKDHVGSFVFAGLSPIIIEEGLASKRALKSLKDSVEKPVFNSIRKKYRVALFSYIAGVLVAAGAAKFGIYAKDKLTQAD